MFYFKKKNTIFLSELPCALYIRQIMEIFFANVCLILVFILEEQNRFLNTSRITSSAVAISLRPEYLPEVNSYLLREERMRERAGAAAVVRDVGMGILLPIAI